MKRVSLQTALQQIPRKTDRQTVIYSRNTFAVELKVPKLKVPQFDRRKQN